MRFPGLLLLCTALLPACASTEPPPRAVGPSHLERAREALQQERLEAAEAEVLLALQVEPRSAAAHGLYASLLARQGRFEQAIVGYERSLSFDPTRWDVLYNLGTLHLRKGDALRAARCLERAVELRADHPGSFNNLAKAYYQLGLPELAGAAYEEALSIDSDNQIARENLELLRRSAAASGRSGS